MKIKLIQMRSRGIKQVQCPDAAHKYTRLRSPDWNVRPQELGGYGKGCSSLPKRSRTTTARSSIQNVKSNFTKPTTQFENPLTTTILIPRELKG